jgi:hypothetical protein
MKDGPFFREFGYPDSTQRKRTAKMSHARGFTKDQIEELCVLICAVKVKDRKRIQHRREQICDQIERTIANLKTWRILRADYRRPPSTFNTTISTVIALHFYANV